MPLAMFAPDARFIFPGHHSFAADLDDPAQVRAWFDRFVALQPHVDVLDVLASGTPGNLRVGCDSPTVLSGRAVADLDAQLAAAG